MVNARAEFSGESSSVSDARRFVRRTLEGWAADEHDHAAALIVTELATNSLLHARGGFAVEVSHSEQGIRIGVSDASRRSPMAKSHSPESTTGRGLQLVTAYAESWGVDRRADGKTVWAVLRTGPDAARRGVTEESAASGGALGGTFGLGEGAGEEAAGTSFARAAA